MSVWEYETKEKPAALLKFDAGAGTGTALFSRYFVEDADGDYTKPGFIKNGLVIPMLIGHNWGETPVGKGKVRSEHDGAYYDFQLVDSGRGRELGAWLRHDFSDGQPKSEFSYGFKILPGGSSREMINGKMLRVLQPLEDGSEGCQCLEISYVLKGSGVSTALVAMKGEQRYHWARRHHELTAQIKARDAAQQAEIHGLYQRFLQREREIQHVL